MNFKEYFETPAVMTFFGNADNMVKFLRLQANYYHMGASPYVSTIAVELEKCADEIEKIIKRN